MDKLRIAIIDPIGKKAGLDHYDRSLADALNKRSCDVKVYSNFSDGRSPYILHHFTFLLHRFSSGPLRFFNEYMSALNRAKKDKTRIVILHLFHALFADFILIRLTRLYGFEICLIVHDVESLLNQGNKSWINECTGLSASVIVHNDFCYTELIKKIRVKNKKKVHIISHGNFIDLPVEQDRGIALSYFNLKTDKKYLLFFGMIKESKGLEVAIEAMNNINETVELIIAGQTRDVSFDKYESMIKRMNLSKRINCFVRYITNEERSLLFCIADAIVLPYRRVYQSGVMLMAMSSGVAVIASDLPVNKITIDGKNGILFQAGNSQDLADKINSILFDEDGKKTLIENAKKYVTENHSWENIADAFINILKN